MQRIRQDQQTLQVELPKQLPEHRSLVVLASGVAGLADRHAQGSGVDRHLGNERGAATGCGLLRAPQRVAVADQLIKIRYTTRDLGDHPVTDRGAWAATSTSRKK